MTAVDIATKQLEIAEGFRAHKYLDTTGKETIGFGFNLDAGISEFAAQALLDAQVEELHGQLLKYPWYAALDALRQAVPLQIAFNGGLHDLLSYPQMIAALAAQDWERASKECTCATPGLQTRYLGYALTLRGV